MIQANELRIGNWVTFDEDGFDQMVKVVEVSENDFRAEGDQVYPPYDTVYEPIPLTPEILEKCGFVLRPMRQSIWVHGVLQLWMGNNSRKIAYLYNGDSAEYIPNTVTSLHQLQNLYFALTGQELNVQL